MSGLTAEEKQDLRKAFDLTQDSGVVDQYGVKKMLQIFNMNPTSEDVTLRYLQHNKDVSSGLNFDEFEQIFSDYLQHRPRVDEALSKTLAELFDGPVKKDELRKILVEMGSEPFEPEEADDIISEISFDEDGVTTQGELQTFLRNKVELTRSIPEPPLKPKSPTDKPPSPPKITDDSPKVSDDAGTEGGQVIGDVQKPEDVEH